MPTFAAGNQGKLPDMNTTLSLENILHMLRGLSLSNRQWLAEHLVEPEEMERIVERKRNEQFVRDMRALQYEGQPTAEEMKRLIRESHYFDNNKLGSHYACED